MGNPLIIPRVAENYLGEDEGKAGYSGGQQLGLTRPEYPSIPPPVGRNLVNRRTSAYNRPQASPGKGF